jgi:hypothetical protein
MKTFSRINPVEERDLKKISCRLGFPNKVTKNPVEKLYFMNYFAKLILMKKQFLAALAIILANGIYAQKIIFKETKYNFGFVHEGDTVNMQFEFENTGVQPLTIKDYKVECGCTVMKIPAEPILPGGKSILKATFDTHQKYDRQDRTIEVISNAENSPSILRFKGVVLKPKKKD